MSRPKKHVYRLGDRVRPIVHDKWIKRIGYPLIWTDLREDVENSPSTWAALATLYGGSSNFYSKPEGALSMIERQIVRVAAMIMVEQRSFGGNIRSIHYHQPPSLQAQVNGYTWIRASDNIAYSTGDTFRITSKKIRKTGIRVPPQGSGYGEDYCEEGGGLSDGKTHIILELGSGVHIEAIHVEPA